MRNSQRYGTVIIGSSVLFLAVLVSSAGLGHMSVPYPTGSGDWLVAPGKRAGAVTLGDAEAKIFGFFPKPSIGSYTQPGALGLHCGTEYTIGLLQDAKEPGFLHVFAKDSKIVEIEADGARYHTAQGVSSNSSPEEVQLHYRRLESYLFLGGYNEALNEGPLVLWTDVKNGIAFTFARPSRGDRRLVVFTMIVFQPNASFCVQGSLFPNSNNWRKLAPYSLGAESKQLVSLQHERRFCALYPSGEHQMF